mmetsp:Transcript_14909/g.28945  ORF Transcript_14909/g.28945 Transcript_14909/m.28945 type:complete len:115 (+) Transcript_14909:382-726(+)|eukprot:CAMPEP_0171486346 /NCGR_PEP_ID=MMETSP0958-20121227/1043_1 /TAXON_ID=87120 /ORGANISM="Aurantiochytrium limacinum, Strain ATCCMYA-1381" /LENGTH=114 /DNA_ID=CAMNT_0012019223 /DNA_START=383 /DNA_END=727 /DNA_ORIENTATION=+
MSRHVKTKEEDLEGHEDEQVEKHLTMRYNMRELRLFNEFEVWVNDWLEEHIPDETDRPVIEAGRMARLSEEKRIKSLKKVLDPYISDPMVRDEFIEEYLARFKELPLEVLDALK